MKDKHIKLITVLMAIALSSLIVLQYIFIRDSIAVKEANFAQTVNEVLQRVSKKIEQQETASLLGKRTIDYKRIQLIARDSLEAKNVLLLSKEKKQLNHPHASLGVLMASAHETKLDSGVLIKKVLNKSHGAKIGLQANDILLSINNNTLHSHWDVRNYLEKAKLRNDSIRLLVRRGNTLYRKATFFKIYTEEECPKLSEKPFLGIFCSDYEGRILEGDEKQNPFNGVLIDKCIPRGAAQLAGLRAGDYIKAVNNEPIENVISLQEIMCNYRIDETVSIDYTRKGKQYQTFLKLKGKIESFYNLEALEDERTKYRIPEYIDDLLNDSKNINRPFWGFSIAQLDNNEGDSGILILEVIKDSPAYKAGLRKDYIITAIDGQTVTSINEVNTKIRYYKAGHELNVSYKRPLQPEVPAVARQPFHSSFLQKLIDTTGISSENQTASVKLIGKETLIEESMKAYFDDMLNMSVELAFIDKPLKERIDSTVLDSILSTSLLDAGIQTPHEYCLVSKNGYPVYHSNNISEKELLETPFKQKVYKNAVFTHPGELLLYFPKQESYIWSSSWVTLFTSLIFNLFIIITFAYTLYTIIRQKKLSEMKTDFINNMTHELKTPISTIKLACEMLVDKNLPKTESRINRYASIISDENSRLQCHVEKVLHFARLEKGSLKLNIETVDIHKLIEEAIQKSSLQIDKKKGTICFDLSATNANVQGDKLHLTNVIYNLLDNAIKYSKEKPEITVFTCNTKSGLQVSIEDNGIGMSKETLKKAFDKFYRRPTGNVHNVKGFGLGLSYVKLMIEAHGGNIWAKSKLNKGSTFEFLLPN